jgi:hypothetical protein
VYVIKFVEEILELNVTSTKEDIRTNFSRIFSNFWFNEADADKARCDFAAEVTDLTETFRCYKRIEEASKERRRSVKLSPCGG